MRRGFKTWCETQATELRNQLKLRAHDRLPAQQLANHLGVTVVSVKEIPDLAQKHIDQLTKIDRWSFSAATISPNGHTIIIYNPSHSPARNEANLMHELAHIILGHQTIAVGKVFHFSLALREFRKEDEEEAEWLGGCLQIPREGVQWAISRGMSQKQIAEHFGASEDMVRYRRNVTGVDRQKSG